MSQPKPKKILTRKEFEQFRMKRANAMVRNKSLVKKAYELMSIADSYHWIHQCNWFGEPILNMGQDILAIQEVIYDVQPDFIIETGVAWGGSMLFYASIMELLGKGMVIGIDIYSPKDLKQRIFSHGNISKRINLIDGSSIEPNTLEQVKKLVGNSKKIVVSLDSNHTHDHVLKELELYSPFIKKGGYLICSGTALNRIPEHRNRAWNKKDNPYTALKAFMKKNYRFEVDKRIDDKLLFSCIPGGFLKCIKN